LAARNFLIGRVVSYAKTSDGSGLCGPAESEERTETAQVAAQNVGENLTNSVVVAVAERVSF
jgi:hypothetical protein